MNALWQHTQEPSLHERWDLRFTRIEYLSKVGEDAPQRFLYTTAIGFGLKIAGRGKALATEMATLPKYHWSDCCGFGRCLEPAIAFGRAL
jgi:hypothetical protein